MQGTKISDMTRKEYLKKAGEAIEEALEETGATRVEAFIVLIMISIHLATELCADKENFIDMVNKLWDNESKMRKDKENEKIKT